MTILIASIIGVGIISIGASLACVPLMALGSVKTCSSRLFTTLPGFQLQQVFSTRFWASFSASMIASAAMTFGFVSMIGNALRLRKALL